MNDKYAESTAKIKSISKIQFSIVDNDETLANSVVKVTSSDLYEKNYPKQGGLCDLRMGTIDKQYRCQTCRCDLINCPGHFGHISLTTPVYNICFLKTLMKVIQCICIRCSKLLVEPDKRKLHNVYDQIKKNIECPFCSFVQPKWTLSNNGSHNITYETNGTIENISSNEVYNIMRKISNDDVTKLGLDPKYSHPKNMLIVNLPVIPPIVRPSVFVDNMVKSQDDLTHKLLEIIKVNNQLEKSIESQSSDHVIQEFWNLLQYHVTTYIDNTIPGVAQATQRTGRPIKSLSQRIKTKEGRVRGNLMGKRVDFSARTVITADSKLDLDELGVPAVISKNMTISETVTSFNKHILQRYVDVGPDPANIKQIGANYIFKDDKRKDLRFVKNVKLEIGDIVERHLKDGDYVIFNRQPSLHKMSMMGHRVKVMDHKTFRMNLSATSPYNADFDGSY